MPVHTIQSNNGPRVVNISDTMLETVELLNESRAAGMATIHRYVSGLGNKKCIRPSISTINFVSRFSYTNHLRRMITKMEPVTFNQVSNGSFDEATFNAAKAELIASAEKTLSGDRSDGHRAAHDKFYIKTAHGIRIHLETEKVNGETRLVLDDDGNVIAESILLHGLQIHKTTHDAGEYKPTKSRAKTLAKRAIEKVVVGKCGDYKQFKLTPDRFDHISIDKVTLDHADLVEDPDPVEV